LLLRSGGIGFNELDIEPTVFAILKHQTCPVNIDGLTQGQEHLVSQLLQVQDVSHPGGETQ
jgi:hypothetical protein